MVRRNNNQLPNNLPQLQNLIKRDPESYKEEFLQQYEHYKSHLEVFYLTPNKYNKNLDELITFLASVAHCYSTLLKLFPQEIITLVETNNTILDSEMRMTFCKALIQLRNKGLVEPIPLLSLFFKLLRCQDKVLRQFLRMHIVTDIQNVNSKQKNSKTNTTLQNFMFSMLDDSNARAAKMSIDILIELYDKNIWNDVKTVNVVVTGCFSKIPQVVASGLKFFLGTDREKDTNESDDSDAEANFVGAAMANKVNKKTKKREKQLKKMKQLFVKSKKKKSQPTSFNFSAIHLIHDPQEFAEKLFKQLIKNNDRYEMKLMTLDVISRLIGTHDLILLTFYPYVQRFLQPRQRDVTKLLQCVAQASHELVPPDAVEPVLKTIVNNFVTERNSSDVMAIGLNAVREICVRCPLVMNEDLLRDLTQYKHHRERSVMMAARSLITLFRRSVPNLLHKKDRGRPTESSLALEIPDYGQVIAKDFVPGAEVLLNDESDEENDEIDSSEDDDEWIDVDHDEEGEEKEEEEEEEEEDKLKKRGKRRKKKIPSYQEVQNNRNTEKITSKEVLEQKNLQASEISTQRLLTDQDFQRIDVELTKKQVSYVKAGSKRPAEGTEEFVSLGNIENIYKKRKHDKQARMESVQKGQEGREKFGYRDGRQNPLCSKTNREKKKNKAYQMIKHKLRGKVKKSFKDKQIALRNHLVKLKKMK